MVNLIFICDEWGVTKGGINSINYDLCMSLGKISKAARVFCVCGESFSHKEYELASSSGVKLIEIDSSNFKNCSFAEILEIEFDDIDTLYWIGHDIITGKQAIACNDYFKNKLNSKLVIFHHMDYPAYYTAIESATKTQAKEKEQNKIFSQADFLFGVGPKLEKSLQDRQLEYSFKGTIYQFKPGLADIKPMPQATKRIKAFVSGRIESKNDKVKQIKLPLIAYCRLLKESNIIPYDSAIYLYGITEEEVKTVIEKEKEIIKAGENEAGRFANINALPFDIRKNVFDKLRGCSVAFMTSLSEGFGLIGFEAIAAGVPLILSKSSGLYELLHEEQLTYYVETVDIKGGSSSDKTNESDVENVKTKLFEVINDINKNKARAMRLIDALREKGYTWENSAKDFYFKLNKIESVASIPKSTSSATESILNIINKNQNFTSEDALKNKSVFISASHDEAADKLPVVELEKVTRKYLSNSSAMLFSKELAIALSKSGHRIVTGYGKGIGPAVLAGVFSIINIYDKEYSDLSKYILTFPFPRMPNTKYYGLDYEGFKFKYREMMCKEAKYIIAIFGFKLDENIPTKAYGVGVDLGIALGQGSMIIPVGSTEFISREYWEFYKDKLDEIYPIKKTDKIDERIQTRNLLYKELGQDIDFEKVNERQKLISAIIAFMNKPWEN